MPRQWTARTASLVGAATTVFAASILIGATPSGVVAVAPSASAEAGAQTASACPVRRRLARRLTLSRPCKTLTSDTGRRRNPLPFWGRVDCADPTRATWIRRGGDRRRQASGRGQRNRSFRRVTVLDGDDQAGERCELGLNDQGGPTALYREGQRRVTLVSLRLPTNSPVGASNWRVVLQMKQAQPYFNPALAPILEVQVRAGRWIIVNDWNDVWATPARQKTWTRFAFDIVYSQNPSVGSIKVYVDRNGDGDARDKREQSRRLPRQTLRPEVGGGPSPIAAGASIPSHLRAGIYQNPVYSCPAPSGCSVDVDNVQIVKP